MHELTGFQRDLLFVIAGLGEPSGIEIKDELDGYYDQTIRHGRLYPNLDTLVEAGLVEKGERNQRTNEYRLRERGRRELRMFLKWQLRKAPEDVQADLTPAASQ